MVWSSGPSVVTALMSVNARVTRLFDKTMTPRLTAMLRPVVALALSLLPFVLIC